MTLHVIFHANEKEKLIGKSSKNIFPNRSIIIFSYNINSSIISSTKCREFIFLKSMMSKITNIFPTASNLFVML